MTYVVALFAIAFVCSLATTAMCIRLAPRLRLVDYPDGFRKLHTRPTALVGGIGIATACFATLGGFVIYHHFAGHPIALARRDLVALSLASFSIVGLGVCDDLWGITARRKLLLQIFAACILVAFGFRLDVLPNPFGQPIHLGPATVPLTVAWLVACTNALNLIDGLDTLAGGIALIAIGAILALSALSGNLFMCLICAALLGSTSGFLLFNRPPARAFLGDSGSMFLGFAYGAIAFRGLKQIDPGFSVVVPAVIFAIPLVDTALAVARRWLKRMPVFSADKDHIHHRLLAGGFTHRQTVQLLHAISFVLAIVGIAIALVEPWLAGVLFTGITVFGIVGLRILWGIDFSHVLCGVTVSRVFRRVKESLGTRQRLVACWSCLQRALSQLERAEDTEGMWHAMISVFDVLHLSGAQLYLRLPKWCNAAKTVNLTWQNGNAETQTRSPFPTHHKLRIPIYSNGSYFGHLWLRLGNDTVSIPGWFQMLEQLGSCAGARLYQVHVKE